MLIGANITMLPDEKQHCGFEQGQGKPAGNVYFLIRTVLRIIKTHQMNKARPTRYSVPGVRCHSLVVTASDSDGADQGYLGIFVSF